MYPFSELSKQRLSSCSTPLQQVFYEVAKRRNCTIICGHRGPAKQNRAFRLGHSKKAYPDSPHNIYPSNAIDAAPYPLDYDDLGSLYMFAGYVQRVAEELGHRIRCGADWDNDHQTDDQTFNDLCHFEYVGPIPVQGS